MDQDPDECVESMPGFHEHDERDLDPSQHDEDEDDRPRVTGQGIAASERLGMDMPKLKPRPPVSAPARSFPNAYEGIIDANDASAADRGTGTSTATRVAKPVSTSNAASSPLLRVQSSKSRISKEPLQCPVCDKTILTDNEGLNAHIDFCLSRNAIREAQAESIASSSTNTKRLKPASQR
jgi:DNA polymerase kappa